MDRYIFPEVENKYTDQWMGATQIYRELDMKSNERVGAVEVARVLKKIQAKFIRKSKKFLVRDHPEYEISSKRNVFDE